MIRIQRFVCYILIFICTIISISFISHLNSGNSTVEDSILQETYNNRYDKSTAIPKKAGPNEEKYLSWFPHSDFPEQQESFRNAIRLALETKRTIIAPMLRINKIYTWLPFEELAKRYEAQEKSTLRAACERGEKNWQTQLEPCETINDWFEVPWSSIMDLKPLKEQYGIKIIERTQGHGWGIHESALGGHVHPDDVAIVDVMTYKENGTDWEFTDPAEEALKAAKEANKSFWTKWFGSSSTKETDASKSSDLPLKYVFSVDRLHALDTKIIQFGALSSAARYGTTQNDIQAELRKSLMKTIFNVPDNLPSLASQADKIVNALGGRFQYSTLILNLDKLVALDARAGSLQRLAIDGKKPEAVNESRTMDELSDRAKKDIMDAVVLEIFGDIPINQAVSAAMPIKPSKLHDLLASDNSLNEPAARRELLSACVDYHRNVEERYPVYYLVNDMGVAPNIRKDIFEPLVDMFPCIFSRQDMLSWGIQSENWSQNERILNDRNIEYEKLFQPLLDILIAGKGYSFFELPVTPLTRFLNWSPKI